MLPFDKIEKIHKALAHARRFEQFPYSVDHLREAFERTTIVDSIEFAQFKPTTGVVRGMIEIYDRAPAPYALQETVAKIYYSRALDDDPDCRRFILVKEMCHTFWLRVDDTRLHTEQDLERLVDALTLSSSARQLLDGPMLSERMAVLAAMEILAPLPFREVIVNRIQSGQLTVGEAAELFGIPRECAETLLDPTFHRVLIHMREVPDALKPPDADGPTD